MMHRSALERVHVGGRRFEFRPDGEQMILLLDNYDSFVHNLARYFRLLGHETEVVRSDRLDVADVHRLSPAAIVLSPGPKRPEDAGCCLAVVRAMAGRVPILGVCLGHQAIGQALGGRIVRTRPQHGRSEQLTHQGEGIFAGLPSPLRVARYHSLAIDPDSLPAELRATAVASDGTVMAIQHRRWPVQGVQFHPESVLTEHGLRMLQNFCASAKPADTLPGALWDQPVASINPGEPTRQPTSGRGAEA